LLREGWFPDIDEKEREIKKMSKKKKSNSLKIFKFICIYTKFIFQHPYIYISSSPDPADIEDNQYDERDQRFAHGDPRHFGNRWVKPVMH